MGRWVVDVPVLLTAIQLWTRATDPNTRDQQHSQAPGLFRVQERACGRCCVVPFGQLG